MGNNISHFKFKQNKYSYRGDGGIYMYIRLYIKIKITYISENYIQIKYREMQGI